MTDSGVGGESGLAARLAAAEEVEVATTTAEGTSRFVPIWVVPVDGELYARSFKGDDGGWYRDATGGRTTTLRLDGVEHEVGVEPVAGERRAEIDEAYRTKYAEYADTHVPPMLTDEVVATTVRFAL